MNELITVIPTGFTAFTATNLDDVFILMLFFSQVNATFRRRHIVLGQYLGFGTLVLISLPGFFGSLIVPQDWVGMLGILPIAIGISRLLNRDDASADDTAPEQPENSTLSSLLSPQTYSVAAVTFANGGDNIGIYVPLSAQEGKAIAKLTRSIKATKTNLRNFIFFSISIEITGFCRAKTSDLSWENFNWNRSNSY